MPILGGCICSAEGVYIYRGEGVHLSRGGVRLMPPIKYYKTYVSKKVLRQFSRKQVDSCQRILFRNSRESVKSMLKN